MMRKRRATVLTKKVICFLLVTLTVLAPVMGGLPAFGVLAETVSMPETAERKEVDVWLIGGQSNAVGYGQVDSYPTGDAYADDKAMLTNGSENVWYYGKDEGTANDPSEFVPSGFGLGQTAARSGAELGITTALDGNGRMNAVIKVAYGASYLYPNTTANVSINYGTWTSPTYIEKHGVSTANNKVGVLYWEFINMVADGLDKLIAKGYTPVIRGMWWMQGEAETGNTTTANAYEELLTTFISDVRSELSEVSGTDCSAMPFVFGRIYRNPNSAHSSPESLAIVQEIQDRVAADESLVNVFEVNSLTDLIDPATGEAVLPVQHDGWHFDALSQQMLGEAFVRNVLSIGDTYTKYGSVSEEYESVETYPFAVFVPSDGGYSFVKGYSTWNAAVTDAKTKGTKVVICLRRDYDIIKGDSSYIRNYNGSFTVDLNGYTLATVSAYVFDEYVGAAQVSASATVTFKNGTMKKGHTMPLIGINSGATAEAVSNKVKKFDFVFDGVTFINANDTKNEIILGCWDNNTMKIQATFTMNDCTYDFGSKVGSIMFGTHTKNKTNTDVAIQINGGKILADNLANYSLYNISTGDSVAFGKGSDGRYTALVTNTTTAHSTKAYPGNMYFVEEERNADTGLSTYYLASMVTPYGTVPHNTITANPTYLSAVDYPFFLFKDGVFKRVDKNWGLAVSHVKDYVYGAAGSGKSAELLLRRDYTVVSSTDATAVFLSQIGGTLVADLNGYTMTKEAYIFDAYARYTDTDKDTATTDDRVVHPTTLVMKNGTLLNNSGQPYMNFNQGTNDSVKVFDVTFDSITFKDIKGTAGNLLLVCWDNSTKLIDATVTYNDCIIDMRGLKKGAALFSAGNSKSNTAVKIVVNGGKIIAYNLSDYKLFILGAEDSAAFGKNADGKYPVLYQAANAPAPTIVFNNTDGKRMSFAYDGFDGSEKAYSMGEIVETAYGDITATFADAEKYPFALFKNGSFVTGYESWKDALVAARDSGDGTVILMRRDYRNIKNDYASVSTLNGTVTVDLNGFTLFCTEAYIISEYVGAGSMAPETSVIFKNGTMQRDRAFPIIGLNQGAAVSEGHKQYHFTFNNVTFRNTVSSVAGILVDCWDNSAMKLKADFIFNDCTFDFTGSSGKDFMIGGGVSKDYTELTVKINGGKIIADDLTNYKLAKLGNEDSMVFGKDDDGKYTYLYQSASAPVDAYVTEDGEMYFTATENDGEYVLAPKACEHVYDNACDKDCNECGETRETAHSYDAVVTEPDCENGGFTTYNCSACGDSYVADETEALGHSYDDEFDADCNNCGAVRDVTIGGECGANATWRYEDGVLYIEGTGSMNSFSSTNAPWNRYKAEITTVIVADGIRSIGKSAFYGCENLTSVQLPATLKTINAYAFYECTSLTEITIPASVTTIRQYAFRRSGLTAMTLETNYGWSAGDEKIAAFELSVIGAAAHAKTISYRYDWTRDVNAEPEVSNIVAFGACGTYAKWTLDNEGVLTISGSGVINNCTANSAPWTAYKADITKVVIEEGITVIGKSAFYEYANITEVVLPSTLTEIGHYAFYGCKGLTEVTIPASVDTIGAYAFRKSGVTSVIFEDTEGWSYNGNTVDVTDAANVANNIKKISYTNVWSK